MPEMQFGGASEAELARHAAELSAQADAVRESVDRISDEVLLQALADRQAQRISQPHIGVPNLEAAGPPGPA